MNVRHAIGILHSFSIKNIFYDKIDLRLFYFDVVICIFIFEFLLFVEHQLQLISGCFKWSISNIFIMKQPFNCITKIFFFTPFVLWYINRKQHPMTQQ